MGMAICPSKPLSGTKRTGFVQLSNTIFWQWHALILFTNGTYVDAVALIRASTVFISRLSVPAAIVQRETEVTSALAKWCFKAFDALLRTSMVERVALPPALVGILRSREIMNTL